MISEPAPVCPATLAEASISFFSRFQMRIRLTCVVALTAMPLCFGGRIASAQTAQAGGSQTTVGSGFSEPLWLAVDANGDLFVSDANSIAIYEILAVNGTIPASPTIRTLYRPSANPVAIAVDLNGNVYFTTSDVSSKFGNNTVTELLAVNGSIPTSPTVRQLGSGLFYPSGVAVDQNGDVFISDSDHSLVKEFVAINGSVPASPSIVTLGSGFSDPRGIAVDGSGNVYVADMGNYAVKEILAVNGSIPATSTIETLASGFCSPGGLALDPTGNLYLADYCNAAVFELAAVNDVMPATPTVIKVASHLGGVEDIAVSTSGTIYAGIVSTSIPAIVPSISNFGSVDVGTPSAVSPVTFTFDTGGILGSVSVLTKGASGLDFVNAGSGTCTAGMAYAAGATCTVDVSFTPLFAGTRTGAVVLY